MFLAICLPGDDNSEMAPLDIMDALSYTPVELSRFGRPLSLKKLSIWFNIGPACTG